MIKQTTVTVGGDEYLISSFPSTRGLGIMKRLAKLIGPAISEMSKENATVASALACLFENMESTGFEQLMLDLTSGVTKNNMALNFDMEFSGEYEKLYQIIEHVVTLNYGSVFQMLGTK